MKKISIAAVAWLSMDKKHLHIVILTLLLSVFTIGCAVQSVPKVAAPVEDYSFTDDPAKYRPEVESSSQKDERELEVINNSPIEAEYNIDKQMEAIVDSMYVRNDSLRLYDGFTILVYSGNNEIEAGRVRNRLFDLVPDQEARFSFKLPTYFVKIGEYFQQLEAEPMLKMIQETYPSAAIVPDKFAIKKEDESSEN